MDIYNILSSNILRYCLIVEIIICVVLMILLDKNVYKCFKVTGISSLLAGVVVKFGIGSIINFIALSITNDVLGKTSDININFLSRVGYTGMILILIYILAKIREFKKTRTLS